MIGGGGGGMMGGGGGGRAATGGRGEGGRGDEGHVGGAESLEGRLISSSSDRIHSLSVSSSLGDAR